MDGMQPAVLENKKFDSQEKCIKKRHFLASSVCKVLDVKNSSGNSIFEFCSTITKLLTRALI